MKYFSIAISNELYEKTTQVRQKWNKELNTKLDFSDIIAISLSTIWEQEIKNSLKESLTNNS